MKNRKIILLLVLSIFFIPAITNAASRKLQPNDIEMECVYDNGKSLTIYHSNGSYGIRISEFKLDNALKTPYSTSLSFFLNETNRAKEFLQDIKCPNNIESALIEQTKEDGEDKTTMQFEVLFISEDATKIMNKDVKQNFVAGFKATSGRVVDIDVNEESLLGKRIIWGTNNGASSFQFYLKSERVFFTTEVEPAHSWAFKSEGQQAASTPKYLKIYHYKKYNGNTIYMLEKDGFITTISHPNLKWPDPSYTHIGCFYESTKIINNDKNDMSYAFSQTRHRFYSSIRVETSEAANKTYTNKCPNGSLYREISLEEYAANASVGTSICDVIPETSLLISTFIYYLGIIVPIFLIIFTAIDITKIVISGNLDEELPKKKKVIITRFIVAVSFFFIPIIIDIFVSSKYGMDFGDISCLFNQSSSSADAQDSTEQTENVEGEGDLDAS